MSANPEPVLAVIPLHTGRRARAMRDTLLEYRMELDPRHIITLRQEVLVAEADRRVVDLFSAAGGAR